MQNKLLQFVALQYEKAGFSVIPLEPKGKRPAIVGGRRMSWEFYKTIRASAKQIEQWWKENPNFNIGIITGAVSNLIVVDVDTDNPQVIKGLNLPNTLNARTAKGWHFYYVYNKDLKIPTNPKIALNGKEVGDIRTDNGYVVAPPSIHVSGTTYEWKLRMERAPFPTHLLNKETIASVEKPTFDDVVSGEGEGNRNNAAAIFIGALIQKYPQHQWETKVWQATLVWNTSNKPPLPIPELKAVYTSICNKELRSNPSKEEAKEAKPKEFKTHKINALKKETPKENPFVVNPFVVENALTIIHGGTGSGKSLLTLKLIDDITLGNKFLGEYETKKTKCLLIDLEMTYDDCIVRARAVCSDENDSDVMTEIPFKVTDKKDMEFLRDYINDNQIGVVVFDTLSKVHSADENSNTQMTPVIQNLVELAREEELAVILIHHINKSSEATGLAKGRGASAIADNAASYLAVSSKQVGKARGGSMTRMKVMQEKARRVSSSRGFEVSIDYDEETDKTTFIHEGELEETENVLMDARKKVLEFVEENPEAPRRGLNSAMTKKGVPTRIVKDVISDLIGENVLVEFNLPKNAKGLRVVQLGEGEQEQIGELSFD
jgi:archaellum biogenesis ATPase FlaH